ncbi:8829_t:CDS:1 [Cetraspora pellucida]|uniref:8829_t:CDS:1 n=1 Tax=Cetraspora pellucida TaxID=1433469 RepID=A0A9N8VAB7_9GLOM|nr:8829_t:CDS:1 [Cetraspora pellucida]
MSEIEEKHYLCSETGEILEKYLKFNITCLVYSNQDNLNDDAFTIKEFNRKLEDKRNEYEKVNVFMVVEQPRKQGIVSGTYVVAGRNNGTKIVQLEYTEVDSFKAMFNLIYHISKMDEFKNKCINIITRNIKFRYMIKYMIYRWIVGNFKKYNDIIGKIENDIEEDKKEDVEYASIIKKIDEIMKYNNVMFDAQLNISNISNVDAFLRRLKPVIRKNK